MRDLFASSIIGTITSTKLIGARGFEPPTSWSQTTRSTKLSYAPDYRWMNIMRGDAAHPESWKTKVWRKRFRNNGLILSPCRATLQSLDLTAARLAASSSPTSPHV
jgi:hypothetical protein